jgi:hypothetical protein
MLSMILSTEIISNEVISSQQNVNQRQFAQTIQNLDILRDTNGLRLVINPPYSHDLALFNFFIFKHVKHYLQRMIFPLHIESLLAISEEMTTILIESLNSVFKYLMERFE